MCVCVCRSGILDLTRTTWARAAMPSRKPHDAKMEPKQKRSRKGNDEAGRGEVSK